MHRVESFQESNPLHLVLGQPFLSTVIELGRARALVRGHFLRVFECAAVRKIGGDPSGAESVISDRGLDARSFGPTADHAPGVRLSHFLIGEGIAVVPAGRAEQPSLAVLGDPGRVKLRCRGLQFLDGK